MPALIRRSIRPALPRGAGVDVGIAFIHICRDASPEGYAELRGALAILAARFRAEGLAPETSVLAFKRAIVSFGGVHFTPSLAEAYHMDGDDCAAAYEYAFGEFVNAFFEEQARAISK